MPSYACHMNQIKVVCQSTHGGSASSGPLAAACTEAARGGEVPYPKGLGGLSEGAVDSALQVLSGHRIREALCLVQALFMVIPSFRGGAADRTRTTSG